jgi:hypothetical protein
MTPYAVFSHVASTATRSAVMETLGTLFVYWLVGAWRLGAIVLFIAFVLFTWLEASHLSTTLAIGAKADEAATLQGRAPDPEVRWLKRAGYVRVASLLFSIALLLILLVRIW